MTNNERYTAYLGGKKIYVHDNYSHEKVLNLTIFNYSLDNCLFVMCYLETEFNREYDLYLMELLNYCAIPN